MLRFISLVVILVFLGSCSKPGDDLPTSGYVSFNVNGTTQDWSEGPDFIMFIIPTVTGTYKLYAQNMNSAKGIELTFLANSVSINTPYTYTISIPPEPLMIPHSISISDANSYDAYNLFTSEKIGDYATVTITAIHDNKADGKFTALLTRRSDSAKINITNGKFAALTFQP